MNFYIVRKIIQFRYTPEIVSFFIACVGYIVGTRLLTRAMNDFNSGWWSGYEY